jgi:hypothetical protein
MFTAAHFKRSLQEINMTKNETCEIGLKLIGVYFAVLAINSTAIFINSLISMAMSHGTPAQFTKTIIYGLLQPGVQIVCALILINKSESITGKLIK